VSEVAIVQPGSVLQHGDTEPVGEVRTWKSPEQLDLDGEEKSRPFEAQGEQDAGAPKRKASREAQYFTKKIVPE
jgi:hypothetical protein